MKNINPNTVTIESIIAVQKTIADSIVKKYQELTSMIDQARTVIPNYQSPFEETALQNRSRGASLLADRIFSVLSENAKGRLGRTAIAKRLGVDASRLQYVFDHKQPVVNGFRMKKIHQTGDSWPTYIKVKVKAE